MEKTMTVSATAEQLIKDGAKKLRVTYQNGNQENIRVFFSQTHNQVCRYSYGRSRYGYRLDFTDILKIQSITSRKSPEQKWREGWTKVKARLEKSGLWEKLIGEIETAFSIGYDRIQSAYTDYWKISYNERESQTKDFLAKYPELQATNDKGEVHIDTSIIWHYNHAPKVKKMRFAKSTSLNENQLESIAKAIKAKKKHNESGRVSYDVSFEYNPDKNLAWYSEEYKGCGNGHYYLALDATHVLFYEDD